MKNTWVIFKKELLDIIRDRRTILVMIVIPLVLFPALMNLAARMTVSQRLKAETRQLKVAVVNARASAEFMSLLAGHRDLTRIDGVPGNEVSAWIKKGKIDFAVVFDADFAQQVAGRRRGGVTLYYKSSEEIRLAKKRVSDLLAELEKRLVAERLRTQGLDPAEIEAVTVREQDVATAKQRLGEAIGGFLPYIFVIFCFIGSMYPAIDLGAGEKERGTMETLLASPASRGQIVAGKFIVITLAGLASAAVSILGLYLSVKFARDIPQEFLGALLRIIEWKSILLVFSLLLMLLPVILGGGSVQS